MLLVIPLLCGFSNLAEADVLFVDRFDDPLIPFSGAGCNLSQNDCSLRGAVYLANLRSGADTIRIPPGTYTLSREGSNEDDGYTGDLDITESVTIAAIAGSNSAFIDANGIDRVFDIHGSSVVTMSGVVIQGGFVDGYNGGGIRMIADPTATLTLSNSTIRNNDAFAGGGICSTGVLNISASTLNGNTAESRGGGIYAFGEINVIDSTLGPTNHAANGGGIYNKGNPCDLLRSTIFGNTVSQDGGGVYNENGMRITNCSLYLNFAANGSGGAIRNDHWLIVENVTMTGNIAAGNLSSAVFNDADSDLMLSETIIQGTCVVNAPVVSYGGNLESPGNTCILSDSTDQIMVPDPMLGTVSFHGGMTRTWDLEPGSPAIDAGKQPWEPDDQRGQPRPIDGDGNGSAVADAGAYEYNPNEILIDGFESGNTSDWSETVP